MANSLLFFLRLTITSENNNNKKYKLYHVRKKYLQERKREFIKCLHRRKQQNQNISYISNILMCKTTSDILNVKQGMFRNDQIRICSEVTARSCNREAFFIEEVRFHPEKDILVTLQIN